jgi:hypothetical protein
VRRALTTLVVRAQFRNLDNIANRRYPFGLPSFERY